MSITITTPQRVLSAECDNDAHEMCPGWKGIWAEGASYASPPMLKIRCGCWCPCTKGEADR